MHFVRKSVRLLKHVKILRALSTAKEPRADTTTVWSNPIYEAGYSTSFLTLLWLLNFSVAMHMRELFGTNHPLLKTAERQLLQKESPSWSLIVLLVSKAVGQNKQFSELDKDLTSGVLHSQRTLSEVTEMIRSSHWLHKSLMNVDASTTNLIDMPFGNKIPLLVGDYLMSISCRELARLKNQELNELMSSALRDLAEGEFIGPRDKQNRSIPGKPRPDLAKIEVSDEFGTTPLKMNGILGNAKAEWTLRNILSGASLLGKSCQGSVQLAGQTEELQRFAYLFGKYLALTIQAAKDIRSVTAADGDLSLVGAPVLFHLQHDPDSYAQIESGRVNFEELRSRIKEGPALEETRMLLEDNNRRALEALGRFPQCESRAVLERILSETVSETIDII